jgi:hypothetical protein
MSCLPVPGGPGKQLHDGHHAVRTGINANLDNLRQELGQAAVSRFLDHYLSLLDQRIARIGACIEERKIESGITILLTLETSSHMVGASELCLRATALRRALDDHQVDTTALYQELVDAGTSTRHLLEPASDEPQ